MYRTSQDRLWLRQHPPYANQGMPPVLLPKSAPASHIVRTQRQTNRIVPSLGYSAPMSAERLAKGRMEKNLTSSVSLYMVG